MEKKKANLGYNEWINSISYNYNSTIGEWVNAEIKKNCHPFLFWLLVKTKNKYLVKWTGFEIRQDIPSLSNNLSRNVELWRHNKFLSRM